MKQFTKPINHLSCDISHTVNWLIINGVTKNGKVLTIFQTNENIGIFLHVAFGCVERKYAQVQCVLMYMYIKESM